MYYYEISESKFFVPGLVEEIGMKIKPTTIFDLTLEYISSRRHHYHRVPDCALESFALVLNTLQAAAVKYKRRHGRVPVLFLDGSDLLAKHNAALFNRLLVHAKILANANKLLIIFVSSEGIFQHQTSMFNYQFQLVGKYIGIYLHSVQVSMTP